MIVLPRCHSQNDDQTSNKPKLRDIPLNVFYNAKVTKVKERLEYFSRLKDTKETQQLSVMCGSELNPFPTKELIGTIGKT